MQNRHEDVVDLLEILHARHLRDQVVVQLKRLAGAEANLLVPFDGAQRVASRYYESMLITVAELLEELGDRRPLD